MLENGYLRQKPAKNTKLFCFVRIRFFVGLERCIFGLPKELERWGEEKNRQDAAGSAERASADAATNYSAAMPAARHITTGFAQARQNVSL